MSFENQDNVTKNQGIKENNHFIEEGFDEFGGYEVQNKNGSETLYSIVPKLINRNIGVEDRAIVRSLFLKNIDNLPILKVGDKIEINQIDNNSYELLIGNNFFIINKINKSFTKISNKNKEKKSQKTIEKSKGQYDLTDEEIETLINAIQIEENKAEIGLFAGKRNVYSLKVLDLIEWHLPTTAEPIDLLVDIDPSKVIKLAKSVMKGLDIDNILINQLIFDGKEKNINPTTSKKILEDFRAFVTSLVEGKKLTIYKEMTSMD